MTYHNIIKVLDQGDYSGGLKLVDEQLKSGGSSELYRIKGQILYETNQVDEALDCLIESVALDQTNKDALVLIGNIYYSDRQDMETTEKYKRVNHVIRYQPDNKVGAHLIMYELVHLRYIMEARGENGNQLFAGCGDQG